MNKKFLSAILFGALMVTSTGTFVSCKDYDEEIEDLQGQISANTTAIAELKALIGDGNYVTSISVNGQNLVVNTKNGSTTVALPACEGGGSLAEVKGNQLFIDGEATGLYGESVKIVDGEWALLQADGTYKPTGIPASGVTVTGDEKNGYVLTVTDAEGVETAVKLPSAASSLTDLIVAQEQNVLEYAVYPYTGVKKIADWKGPRTLPAEQGKTVEIVTANKNPLIQINPTSVDAADLTLNLVDSKNNTPAYLSFTPKAYTTLLTRAANANGLYTLAMNEVLVPSDKLAGFEAQFKSGTQKLYAVTAGSEVRSEYEVTVVKGNKLKLEMVGIKDANGNFVKAYNGADCQLSFGLELGSSVENAGAKVNVGEWYNVVATKQPQALYDMHLSASADDVTLFGIEFKEEAGSYQFRMTTVPDNITRAGFKLNIETIAMDGENKTAYVWVGQSSVLTNAYTYEMVEHQLVANNATASKEKNFFSIDLNLMKNAMTATNKALWNSYAKTYDLTIIDQNDNNKVVATDGDGIVPEFVTELKDGKGVKVASSYGVANNIKFHITNNTASAKVNSYINKEITAVVNFYKDAAKKELLNTIKVPFKLTIPALGNYLPKQQGVFNGTQDGTAYIFGTSLNNTAQTVRALQYDLSYAFVDINKALEDGTKLYFTTNGKVGDNVVAKFVDSSKTTYVDTDCALTMDGAKAALVALTGNNKDVYGQPIKIEIANTTKYLGYYTWTDDERAAEAFTIKMLSPIAEGNLTAADGTQTITITSTDQMKIGESKFAIATYANIAYKLFPSAGTKAASDIYEWITYNSAGTVTITSKDTKVLTVKSIANGTDATADAKATEGYVEVAPVNAAYDTEGTITVVVNDAWGFKLEKDVTIKITK